MFQRTGYKTVYVAGDTVWNAHMDNAIKTYKPDVIVLNTGYACVLGFDGLNIVGKEDLYRANQAAPQAVVIHNVSVASPVRNQSTGAVQRR